MLSNLISFSSIKFIYFLGRHQIVCFIFDNQTKLCGKNYLSKKINFSQNVIDSKIKLIFFIFFIAESNFLTRDIFEIIIKFKLNINILLWVVMLYNEKIKYKFQYDNTIQNWFLRVKFETYINLQNHIKYSHRSHKT